MVNDQRKAVFEQRQEFMAADDVSDQIAEMRDRSSTSSSTRHLPERPMPSSGTSRACEARSRTSSGLDLPIVDWAAEEGIADEEMRERILKAAETRAAERAANVGADRCAMWRKLPAADDRP